MMGGPRKKAPKTIAVIDPDQLLRRVCVLDLPGGLPGGRLHRRRARSRRPDGLRRSRRPLHRLRSLRDAWKSDGSAAARVRLPADYDAINMMPFEEVVKVLQASRTEATQTQM